MSGGFATIKYQIHRGLVGPDSSISQMGSYDDQPRGIQMPTRCEECGAHFIFHTSTPECPDCGLIPSDFERELDHVAILRGPESPNNTSSTYTASKSSQRIERNLNKYNPFNRSKESFVMEYARKQITHLTPEWDSSKRKNEADFLVKKILNLPRPGIQSNARLSQGYSAPLFAAVLAEFVYRHLTNQTISTQLIRKALIAQSIVNNTPCGNFAEGNEVSLKSAIRKVYRTLSKWAPQRTELMKRKERLLLARKESLEDMSKLLISKDILPKNFAIPETVLAAIDEYSEYPLVGRAMLSYHQEVLYQMAQEHSKVSRREIYNITEGMGGVEKFANHAQAVQQILQYRSGGN